MKKILPILSLLFITALSISCSNDNDNTDYALMEELQGKWKLTARQTDTDIAPVPVDNGYVLELKSNREFTSDEVNGYLGGHYTIINKPGSNIMLVYQRSVDSKLVYKHFSYSPENNTLHIHSNTTEPLPDDYGFMGADILTRVE